MKILGVYQIHYVDKDIKQIKNLISHDDYENIIIPKRKEIYELQLAKKDKEASIIKKELNSLFGENWFTDKSPLFDAISTEILSLPDIQGGNHKCKLTQLETV